MKVHGACHCNRIRYEAEVDPAQGTICHCTDCQALTGTAWRVSVPTRVGDFVLLAGTPKLYVKTADSGAQRVQAFCGDCGSPLYTHAVDRPQTYGLRTGTIEEREQLLPLRQIWCRSALSWAQDIQQLPASPGE